MINISISFTLDLSPENSYLDDEDRLNDRGLGGNFGATSGIGKNRWSSECDRMSAGSLL